MLVHDTNTATALQVPALHAASAEQQPPSMLQLLGIRAAGLLPAVTIPLLLTCILFVGPLLFYALCPSYRRWRSLSEPVYTIHDARDYIIAPIAEEWVFRACMAPILWLQGVSKPSIVFMTPLFFGAAHLHHLGDLVLVSGVPKAQAFIQVLFQFAYTTIFGWFATYTFLSTGHLLSAVLVHVLCNVMGFPPLDVMRTHARANFLLAATVLGMVAFAVLLRTAYNPAFFNNSTFIIK